MTEKEKKMNERLLLQAANRKVDPIFETFPVFEDFAYVTINKAMLDTALSMKDLRDGFRSINEYLTDPDKWFIKGEN